MAYTTPSREALLESLEDFAALVELPEVGASWSEPSVLNPYSVGDIAGHVLSAVSAVERYVERPVPSGAPIATGTFFSLLPSAAENPRAHEAVLQRSRSRASSGQESVVRELRDIRGRLRERLGQELPERNVQVMGGLVIRLDDYIETRIVEVVVHFDDLSISAGLDRSISAKAVSVAIHHLVEVGRSRHGDLTVLRALSRRERVASHPFPVL